MGWRHCYGYKVRGYGDGLLKGLILEGEGKEILDGLADEVS